VAEKTPLVKFFPAVFVSVRSCCVAAEIHPLARLTLQDSFVWFSPLPMASLFLLCTITQPTGTSCMQRATCACHRGGGGGGNIRGRG
jgi:hypothetical protein